MPPIRNKYWKKPKYVKLYESGGHCYAYYRRDGSEIRIEGAPGTKAWLDRYEEIHTRFKHASWQGTPEDGSLGAGIIAYKKSDRYLILADSTKKS